jgi:preprotein translocase subunit SecF
MILGVIVGTYSSIYVSSSLLITLGIDKSRFKQMNQAVDKKKAARERAERIAPKP